MRTFRAVRLHATRRMGLLLLTQLALTSGWNVVPSSPPVSTTGGVAHRPTRTLPVQAQLGSSGYRVRLSKPLGILFEEVEVGAAKGVAVAGLVEGGAAELDGRVLVGDKLLRTSAVMFGGDSALLQVGGKQFTKVSRELIPATSLDFDTIMSAIGSNDGRYGYMDVVLELTHTDASVLRPPRPASERAERREADAGAQWDGARGTTVGGRSTPIRAAPDDF